jgi:hypothetical protein
MEINANLTLDINANLTLEINANLTLEDEKYNVTSYHTYNRINDSSYYNTNIIYISIPHQLDVPRIDQHYLIQRHFM